jgi:uncharacterized protein (TIGR02001 family)
MFATGVERHQLNHAPCAAAAWLSLLCLLLLCMAPRCVGADAWGGSLDLTSDYFVRGISRSDDHAALQLDLHYLNASGFVADFFASNSQIDPDAKRDAELSAFLGYVWPGNGDWHGKLLAGSYTYPWNQAGSQYNYDEIDFEVAYRDWLHLVLSYSPDTQRYTQSYYHDRSLVRVGATSAELDFQRSVTGKLSATAGVGYYRLDGSEASGYAYWSVGAAYDLTPVSLAVSYIGATKEANTLFYNAAVGGRWSGTVIWRF